MTGPDALSVVLACAACLAAGLVLGWVWRGIAEEPDEEETTGG